MKGHNFDKKKGILTGFLHQLLYIDIIRYIVALIRYIYFVKIQRRLKTLDLHTESVGENTICHNIKGMKDLAVVRSLTLIKPLSSVESLGKNSTILSIGPRTEGELLNLVAYGFLPRNIKGLDLISYSKWIDLGDMHKIPYKDNSWDAILMGWVIAYSSDPMQAAKEVTRISKNGTVVAIGVEYNPLSQEEIKKQVGYIPGANKRILSTDEILNFFGTSVEKVYFRHDISSERKDKKGSICVVFSIKK